MCHQRRAHRERVVSVALVEDPHLHTDPTTDWIDLEHVPPAWRCLPSERPGSGVSSRKRLPKEVEPFPAHLIDDFDWRDVLEAK